MNLSTIKNKFFNYDRVLRQNKFAIDMSFVSPVNGGDVHAVGEPAVLTSSPTVNLMMAPFEFQNVPLKIPVKREAQQDLLIRFYAVESLNIYTQLLTLIKQYGGEPTVANARPTAYAPGTMYNETIRNNRIIVRMITSDGRDGGINPQYDGAVNYIEYSDAYPHFIQPINFSSESDSQPLTFDVLFKYSYNFTRYETTLGGTNF